MRSRAPAAALLVLLAAAQAACVAYPRYPHEAARTLLADVAPLGGTVRLDATFELSLNGSFQPAAGNHVDYYLAKIAAAYRESPVFERVVEARQQPKFVASVRGRARVEGSMAWYVLSLVTLTLVPHWSAGVFEIDTVVRDAASQREIGRSRVCHTLREVSSIVALPAMATNAPGKTETDTIIGLARTGLALAVATDADRARAPALVSAAESACPEAAGVARRRAKPADPRGSWSAESARREDAACLDRPGVRAYVRAMQAEVDEAIRATGVTPRPVEITVQLDRDGRVGEAHAAPGADPTDADRALSGLRAAEPFALLDEGLACLATEAISVRFAE